MQHDELGRAIRRRAVVAFYYDGGLRLVEPHVYGQSRDGRWLMRGFQTHGFSRSGQRTGWKLFRVGKMDGVRQVGVTFGQPRPRFSRTDPAIVEVRGCV